MNEFVYLFFVLKVISIKFLPLIPIIYHMKSISSIK